MLGRGALAGIDLVYLLRAVDPVQLQHHPPPHPAPDLSPSPGRSTPQVLDGLSDAQGPDIGHERQV
jgi:hypothetical protein